MPTVALGFILKSDRHAMATRFPNL